ncbi:MAG TPA: zinc ribbon domain-containing protein [Candidatus Dormibacteraeota bacterium]
MPIYEYRCAKCGKRSSALLPRWDAPDPPCRHCGARRLQRLVSTFATQRSDDADDFGPDFDDGGGGDDDEGGFGGGDDDF